MMIDQAKKKSVRGIFLQTHNITETDYRENVRAKGN